MTSPPTPSDPRLRLVALVADLARTSRTGYITLPCDAVDSGVEGLKTLRKALNRATKRDGIVWSTSGLHLERDECRFRWRPKR